ncbi:MAG: pyridoxamine 5'-phosphate oxidase family protein [Leptospiraceae bacterium]|nr:pyridoxamine 5'-phosphate oxidase family protein [Leptospiraceae bacterium]
MSSITDTHARSGAPSNAGPSGYRSPDQEWLALPPGPGSLAESLEQDMQFEKTDLNTVKRGAHKASYDKDTIYAILDAAVICTVAFNLDGRALLQPINFGRRQDCLYLHGSPKNRMTSALIEAGEATVSVFHLDAMKLTRSAFHHSVNFRSVNLFCAVRELESDAYKLQGLKTIINHFVPDRWQHCRPPNANELLATRVLELRIISASAKVADSPPQDNPEDLDLDYWAGQIPVRKICGDPIADPALPKDAPIPPHVLDYCQRRSQ